MFNKSVGRTEYSIHAWSRCCHYCQLCYLIIFLISIFIDGFNSRLLNECQTLLDIRHLVGKLVGFNRDRLKTSHLPLVCGGTAYLCRAASGRTERHTCLGRCGGQLVRLKTRLLYYSLATVEVDDFGTLSSRLRLLDTFLSWLILVVGSV